MRVEATPTSWNLTRRQALIAGAAACVLSGCGGSSGESDPDPVLPAGDEVPAAAPVQPASRGDAARFLQQATLGPSSADVDSLMARSFSQWLDQQVAQPFTGAYVETMQAWFDRGNSYHPGNGGVNYSPSIVEHRFWHNAINGPDALRHRMVHTWIQIFVVSLEDSNLYDHGRAFGSYLDQLGTLAFANFRDLLEMVALSPVMGMYLSHIRNQKEDLATGRLPDENFAREVMQLFTIGLHELNLDGTEKLDAQGRPIETYNNTDVSGLARVFTGWSWGFDDQDIQSNGTTFKWGGPGRYLTTGAERFDLRPMRIYPDFHSSLEKKFLGVTIPVGTPGTQSLRTALDTLFQHSNVGPFIGKQLIQRLVTSNPSASFVRRVARVFNDNGLGVRGDMTAVIKAILLDPEARQAPRGESGKIREPVLRVTQWARAFGAESLTGRWMMGGDLRNLSQAALHSPSVFNFYRPGYVPPNTSIATNNMVAPEMQIVNESTVAEWTNFSFALAGWGTGWTGSGVDIPDALKNKTDVYVDFASSQNKMRLLVADGIDKLIDEINVLFYGGQMSAALRAALITAVDTVPSWDTKQAENRCRTAMFLALAAPEFLAQR
jgi:uncharacterized protein (DUF1800 family)